MFRLTEGCESLSCPDSIYHLFAYRKAAVSQVFVRHLLVPHKDCTAGELCALLVTAVEGACGEMRVFINTNKGEDHFVRVTYTNGAEGVAVVSAYHIDKGDENDELIPYSNALLYCYARSYKKRLIARNIGTTYVYDFPASFGTTVVDQWNTEKRNNPDLYKKQIALLSASRSQALQADNEN
ncbi:hypothetical protein QR680_001176 [Steinernema hermaphroditum]|uniref:Uncharacterized protein n=1 Tax=Steinernema hermaphroditum TaxID=289476 RepID=A0AA39LFH0_9BILA|nr:hypothetical protein QR680_001176 [Steinernema hermaphroditum]